MNLLLYTIVSISGASVLALEILGTRVLGPFYGVSLFLWSALITVTLAALSLGYVLGGRLADRDPRPSRLAGLLGAAGAWVLATPWLVHPLLSLTEPLGLRTAVLAAALVLFAPPLTLLGTVSPFVIRAKTAAVDEVGRVAGNVFAVSTVASVAAALATGFLLIPAVGVRRLLVIIGGALLVAAALAALAPPARRRGTALAWLAILAAGGAAGWRSAPGPDGELVWIGQSPYAELRVLDLPDGARYFLIDGGVHTVEDPETGRSWHHYVSVVDLARYYFDDPGSLLLVGLGGGSVAKSFANEGWSVDAVEIDPGVVGVARGLFGLEDRHARIHVADGRRFLAATSATWDVVVLDAFGSSAIPFHLVTEEAFAELARRIAPGGLLLVNVEAVGWRDKIVRALAAGISRSFRHVLALPLAEPPNTLGNVILLATDREDPAFPEEKLEHPYDALASGDSWRHFAAVARHHAWDNRFVPDTTGVPRLTDDRNPVDVWAEEINRVARRQLHETFAKARSW